MAKISERQTNAPPSGERTAYLEERNQGHGFRILREEK
jgi:hypothetical protein